MLEMIALSHLDPGIRRDERVGESLHILRPRS
jgi:hypothetical protein